MLTRCTKTSKKNEKSLNYQMGACKTQHFDFFISFDRFFLVFEVLFDLTRFTFVRTVADGNQSACGLHTVERRTKR